MTRKIFGCRTLLGTQDANFNVREKIVDSILNNKKDATITWDVRSAFNKLPNTLIIASLKMLELQTELPQ